MRKLDFGEKIVTSSNLFVRVKEKGDSITFRIAQPPVYEGKHFIREENGWKVEDCPRINSPEEGITCEYCEKYFEIMGLAKEASQKKDKDAEAKLREEARKYNVSISFYFPILNRDTQQFQILQTTLGVRNKMDEYVQAGVDAFASEWVLRNTGSSSPRDRYSLIRKDSSEVKPLTDKEKEELEKAKQFDILKISSNISKRDLIPESEKFDEDIVEAAKEIFDANG